MNNGIPANATAQGYIGSRSGTGVGMDKFGARGFAPGVQRWDYSAWVAAYNRALVGGGQAHIMCLGDSCTEGTGTTDFSNRWGDVMKRIIDLATGVPTGTGIVAPHMWQRGFSAESRFVGTKSQWQNDSGGGGLLDLVTWNAPSPNATLAFTPTQEVESFVVWSSENGLTSPGETWTVDVDGTDVGGPFTVAGVVGIYRREFPVALGRHTFNYKTVGAPRNAIIGFEGVRNPSRGVKVTTAGRWSLQMVGHDDYAGWAGSKDANNWAMFRATKPDLMIWAFGLNEWNQSADRAGFASKFDELARYQRTTNWPCSICLLVQLPPDPSQNASQSWDNYANVIRNAALRYGWGLIDVTAAWGSRANKPLNYQDLIHPTDAGYAEIGVLAAEVVLAPVGQPVPYLQPPPPAGPAAGVPSTIAGLGNWYDATVVTSFTFPSGSNVTQWRDLSGNLRHLNQSSTATAATTRTGTMNGLATVVANGTSAWMDAVITATATRTIFVVAKKTGAITSTSDALFGNSPTVGAQVYTNSADSTGYNHWNPRVTTAGGTPTNPSIVSLTYASTSSCTMRVNGGAGVTFNPDDFYSTSTEFCLFAARVNASGNTPGDFEVGEVIIYETALSLADTNTIGNYLATKWGITWTTAT